jgi:outer membrane protein assembly factor BamB
MSLQIENKPGLWRAGRLRVPRAGARTAVVVAMALAAIAVQAPQALASGGSHAGGTLAQAPRLSSFSHASGPSIKLSPGTGSPTQAVTVSGGGFGASERVDIYFDATDEARGSTNASGHFSGIRLQVPAAATPGVHWISVRGRHSGLFARRAFIVSTPWNQYGRVANHTHANRFENVLGPGNVSGLTQAWQSPIGGLVYSSPAVVHGVLYIGSYDHNVYALNAGTGAKRWSYTTGNQIFSSPAVVNGVLYIGSSDHRVYALNAATGAKRWIYRTGRGSGIMSSPAVANGVVYIGAVKSLYALNAKTGAKLWSYATGHSVYSSPAVANGVVYVGSVGNNIYAIDAATGAKLWSYDTAAPIYQASPTVANGIVYANSYDSLYALDAATGALRWSSGAVWGNSSPAVANGVVYIGSFDGNVYALDAVTGDQLWSYTTGDEVLSSPAVANGVVYIGSTDGNVYALDAATGAKLWSYPTGGVWDASPAVVNGAVYIGATSSSSVYAFGLPAGP